MKNSDIIELSRALFRSRKYQEANISNRGYGSFLPDSHLYRGIVEREKRYVGLFEREEKADEVCNLQLGFKIILFRLKIFYEKQKTPRGFRTYGKQIIAFIDRLLINIKKKKNEHMMKNQDLNGMRHALELLIFNIHIHTLFNNIETFKGMYSNSTYDYIVSMISLLKMHHGSLTATGGVWIVPLENMSSILKKFILYSI